MAGEDVRLKATIKNVEDELNLIKNQVQQTLLDIREHILDVTNPFNNAAELLADEPTHQAIVGPAGASGTDGKDSDSSKGGDKPSTDDDSKAEDEPILPEDPLVEDHLADLPEDDVLAMDSAGADTQLIMDDSPATTVISGGGEGFDAEEFSAASGRDDDPQDVVVEDRDDESSDSSDSADSSDEEETEAEASSDDDESELDEPGDNAKPAQPAVKQPGVAFAPLPAELDLVTMAALVRWVSVTMQALGRNRTEVLLDTYEMAGRISPQVRGVVRTICALQDEDPDGALPVRDVLAAMVRMEGVLGSDGNSAAHRLMAILLDDEAEPLTRMGIRG